MPDSNRSDRKPTRRSMLRAAVAASGATALAGCLGDDIEITINSGSDDEGAGSDDGSGTGSDGDSESTGDSGEDSEAADHGDDGSDDDTEHADHGDDDSDDDLGSTDGGDETDPAEEDDDETAPVEEDDDETDSAEEDDNDEKDPDEEDDDEPKPSFSEDCINVDPSDLTIDEISGNRWRVRSGRSALLIFDEKENAEDAKAIIEHYGFTSYCFVGRPDPPMTYWLENGNAPSASGSFGGSEDCINIDPSDLTIDEISGNRWRVRSGRSALLIFDEKENAEDAKAIIEHYGFTSYCFVGRPDPPMTYWTS
ncbi:hypothetical protein [Natrarchaeobius chitinivorans]|uniref:hypothetical protein n=1 Tax=Natrarchaeobius chitinivorans TaxID=1679083 RepID=UPI0014044C15|nr:hypothetical protein [Natrarchaeobius chitinivorans]